MEGIYEMISEKPQLLQLHLVAPNYQFSSDDYPHYLIKPIQTEADNDYCLLLRLSLEKYIILNPKLKRYQAVKLIRRYMETAHYQTIEIK